MSTTDQNAQIKRIIKLVFGLVLTAIFLFSLGSIIEDVAANEIVVIQMPVSGELKVVKESGWTGQWWGTATHYKKSNQYWFTAAEYHSEGESDADLSIPIVFNDGGSGSVSGSVRWDMPLDDKSIITIHSRYGTQLAIENQLIRTAMQKAIYFSGPLMSSKESYAEKKNDLIYYIEDQASDGVYKTISKDIKGIDPMTEKEKTVTVVQILEQHGMKTRQEDSQIKKFGVNLSNLSINKIKYDDIVTKQIAAQQKATMDVQLAIANAKKAEQQALTVAKQGEADAAKAKWAQEVIKAQMVTEAEQKFAVAQLEAKAAEENKRKLILEGQGEAEKRRLVMQADGALDKRLDAQVKINQAWADAFAKYEGSYVPYFNMQGGGSGKTPNAMDFMDLMKAQAAMQMSNTKK